MKDFLKKIKVLDTLTTELEIDKNTFVSKLKEHVDQGSTGLLTNPFEVFSSSKNEFKGHVDHNGFKIKRRKRMFDTNSNFAVAEGKFSQKYDTLIIETEINAFSNWVFFFFFLLIVFYLFFFGSFFFVGEGNFGFPVYVLPFLIIHGLFMIGVPYFLMRRSTKKMKRELEREFYYMTKK